MVIRANPGANKLEVIKTSAYVAVGSSGVRTFGTSPRAHHNAVESEGFTMGGDARVLWQRIDSEIGCGGVFE